MSEDTRSPISLPNCDRPYTTHKPDRLFPQIKQRSPSPTKSDRLFPTSTSDVIPKD